MSTKLERSQRAEQELDHERSREAAIRKNVINELGLPGDLQQVQVRPLWEGNYRVNVFVGIDATSSKVAHSFFLKADAFGEILDTTPAIKKHY